MPNDAYRILTQSEFTEFATTGVFAGAQKDREAGFIHLSTLQQLPKRLDRYRSSTSEIYILAIDLDQVRHAVRWERAGDGDVYPHLFESIRREFAREADADICTFDCSE